MVKRYYQLGNNFFENALLLIHWKAKEKLAGIQRRKLYEEFNDSHMMNH